MKDQELDNSQVDIDSEDQTIFKLNKGQGGLSSFFKAKRYLIYGIPIVLSCVIIIISVFMFPSALDPNHPVITREDYHRITQETLQRTYETVASMSLRDTPTLKRRFLHIHIPCAYSEVSRRTYIRIHQIEPYKSKYDIDFKFVLGEPDPIYRKTIQHEIDTYGDIIILPGYMDSREGGRTTKSPEYFKWLVENTKPGEEFKFIGRMDSDVYLNFDNLFANRFNSTYQENDDFLICTGWLNEMYNWSPLPNDWPQGSFYIFSWKMMLMYTHFYTTVPRELGCDDQLIGRYIYDSGLNITNVRLYGHEAYDFQYTWEWDTRWKIKDAIRVHELKSDHLYLTIATDLATLAELGLPDFTNANGVKSVTTISHLGDIKPQEKNKI